MRRVIIVWFGRWIWVVWIIISICLELNTKSIYLLCAFWIVGCRIFNSRGLSCPNIIFFVFMLLLLLLTVVGVFGNCRIIDGTIIILGIFWRTEGAFLGFIIEDRYCCEFWCVRVLFLFIWLRWVLFFTYL